MKKEIIAIDGPAASGKSTVAKIVAKKLGYKYIDSGAMYRCVALYVLENKIELEDINSQLDKIRIDFDVDNNVFLNERAVSKAIRTKEVTGIVAQVAALKEVREKLVKMQQELGLDKGIVMDGRDIGTVVFPQAKVKIFLIASVTARAQRRYHDYLAAKMEINLAEIEAELTKRDYDDTHREISPLIKAKDAIELDTSNLTVDESVIKIIEIFKEKVK